MKTKRKVTYKEEKVTYKVQEGVEPSHARFQSAALTILDTEPASVTKPLRIRFYLEGKRSKEFPTATIGMNETNRADSLSISLRIIF